MNEANIDVGDGRPPENREPGLGHGHDQGHAQSKVDDALTSRLPPVPRPPMMPGRPISHAPGPVPLLPSVQIAPDHPEVHQPPAPRPSGWKALLATTLQPPANTVLLPAAARALEQWLALGSGILGVALLLFGIIVGLWVGSPPSPPAVGGAVVIARALVGLGMIAFGISLVRTAERLFARSVDEGDEGR